MIPEHLLDPGSLGDHVDRLFRAAWAMSGSREEAEDLVQETYLRVLSRPRIVRNDDDLVDPAGIGPSIWFQQMDAPRPQRNRIHFDVIVGHDQAEARVAAAIAAGGHLVSDERAPAFWVLADGEGNEVCVCTWQARSNS